MTQNSNSRLIIDSVSRDKYFYDHYKFSYKFALPELTALRKLDHKHVDEVIERRKKLGFAFGRNYGGSWGQYQRPITDQMLVDLHKLCTLLLAHDKDYKFTINGDIGFVYTNDIDFCTTLHQADWLRTLECRQVQLDFPRNSIRIRSAKHDKRTYFRNQTITLDNKKRLEEVISNNNVRPGPGLSQWFDRFAHSKYVCDNYFIDHNDDNILTLLTIATGIKIKRTVSIIRDK